MKRQGCSATVQVTELLVRTALPDFRKAQLHEKGHDFSRLQDWHLAHRSRHFHGLGPDEHAVEPRVAFLEKHLDDLLQIGP